MKHGRKLTLGEKRFLTRLGMNPNMFLRTKKTAEFYEFYKIDNGKLVNIRR